MFPFMRPSSVSELILFVVFCSPVALSKSPLDVTRWSPAGAVWAKSKLSHVEGEKQSQNGADNLCQQHIWAPRLPGYCVYACALKTNWGSASNTVKAFGTKHCNKVKLRRSFCLEYLWSAVESFSKATLANPSGEQRYNHVAPIFPCRHQFETSVFLTASLKKQIRWKKKKVNIPRQHWEG